MASGETFAPLDSPQVELSVVAPFFDESESIIQFCGELRSVLDSMQIFYEVLLVNDGSKDDSRELLSDFTWPECAVIDLADNVGHQRAIEAGLSQARGHYVVTIDSDLQHPPALIVDLYAVAVVEGVDVVYGVRRNNVSNSLFKRVTSGLYYRAVRLMAPFPVVRNAADFRLISRRANLQLRDSTSPRAFRVLIPSLRLPSAVVEFDVSNRFSGESKYSIKHQFHLAILSVLVAPSRWLRLFGALGIGMAVVGCVEFLYAIYGSVRGYDSTGLVPISILTLGVGLQLSLLAFGIEYLVHLLSARTPNSRYRISSITSLG